MSIVSFFAKGLLIGFSIAAPVGPIGILCIRQTLMFGVLAGLACGLGAAIADLMYGIIGGFGLTCISSILLSQKTILSIAGGLFLGYLGIKTLLEKPADNHEKTSHKNLLTSFIATFLLTLTNPMTILSFTAILAGLGLGTAGTTYQTALVLVSGIFIGSLLWWFLLCGSVSIFRQKITSQNLLWINRISGTIILCFAIIILLSICK